MIQPVSPFFYTIIHYCGLHRNLCLIQRSGEVTGHKGSEWSHMYGCCLIQPHMPINTGSLVKPALFQTRVNPDYYQILSTVIQIIGDVIHLSHVTARLFTQEKSVDPYTGIPENTIELQIQMFSEVRSRYGNCLPIPPHTRFGIFIPYCLISMTVTRLGRIRKIYHPVVRQIDRFPGGCIKF